jgi:hypothetical protein
VDGASARGRHKFLDFAADFGANGIASEIETSFVTDDDSAVLNAPEELLREG